MSGSFSPTTSFPTADEQPGSGLLRLAVHLCCSSPDGVEARGRERLLEPDGRTPRRRCTSGCHSIALLWSCGRDHHPGAGGSNALGRSEVGIEQSWVPASNGPVELVVDLANVCRSEDIPPSGKPSWARLETLAESWSRWPSAYPNPRVKLIADSSLRGDLSPSDKRLLRDAENEGWAEVHDYADPVILDYGEEFSCLVLSRDQFVGFRRERPWIEESPDQFITWVEADGRADLRRAEWRARTDYSVSRAAERDELKALRIDPSSERGSALLRNVYRCDNPGCMRRAFGASDAEVAPTPTSQNGSPVCQNQLCRQPLTVVGRRAETAIVKLAATSDAPHWERIPLSKGTSLVIGRASEDISLKDIVSDADRRRISRTHLKVAFDGHRVFVADLGSSNGSEFRRWDRADRRHRHAERLRNGEPEELGPRDRVILGGVLLVERSGRRFPFDLAPTHTEGETSGPVTHGHNTREAT